MAFIITLDIGTTSIKTCIFDQDFRLLAFNSDEYELYTPERDIIELDPEVYWEKSKTGIKKAIELSGAKPSDIKVIAITSQGETLIPVDKSGKALYNAVNWLDARAFEESKIISGAIGAEEFYRTTGVPEAGPACPVCKVLWFKTNRKDIFEKTHKFLLLEDLIIHKLTGNFVAEPSLLSSTGYFDSTNCRYWDKILDFIGVKSNLFSTVLPCGSKAGNVKSDVAAELGLSAQTIVSTGAMDQVASAIGAGNIKPGIVTETLGTALVIGATIQRHNLNSEAKINVLKHYNDSFLAIPYCPTAGIILKWFKDEFCREEVRESMEKGISVYEMLDSLAAKVKPGANGLILLPHFEGILNPDLNPAAKGVFYGISLDSKKEFFIRAILESIGYMLRENLELLEKMGIKADEIRSIGGGSKSSLWSAIKADIIGKPITVMEQQESTSLGAAILGAVAVGMYGSVEEASSKVIRINRRYNPDKRNTAVYNKNYLTYKKLYESLKELFLE